MKALALAVLSIGVVTSSASAQTVTGVFGAESGSQSSNYDFNAIYNGQELHNRTVNSDSAKMIDNSFLNQSRTDVNRSNSSADLHKDSASSTFDNRSQLSIPAIPGTDYGVVNVSGAKTTSSDTLNVNTSASQNSFTSSNLNQDAGQTKVMDATSIRQQDLKANQFGSGSFSTNQDSYYSPFGIYLAK